MAREHVLFLCTANACRSQMAEGWFKALAPEGMTAESAGSNPVGHVHPVAVDIMAEAGVDISGHLSKGLDAAMYSRATRVVVVCAHANQRCPAPPPGIPKLFWPIRDPGTLEDFRLIRDEIRGRIEGLLKELSGKIK